MRDQAAASATCSSSTSRLRVCVLHPSFDGCSSVFEGIDPSCTPEAYDTAGTYEWSHAQIRKISVVQQIRDLSNQGIDVFLNLCDGAFDEERAGLEVVAALDRYGCAYTGADTIFYEPSKELMKKMAYYHDIGTAPWAFVFKEADLDALVSHLRYPLIVKHYNGYSSIGMGRDSRVEDLAALRVQVSKFITAFGGALVEEFIVGREFTVLVAEQGHGSGGTASLPAAPPAAARHPRAEPPPPVTYLPVECIFGGGETFKHFDLKWRDYDLIKWVGCEEPELAGRLRDAAARAFTALRGCSYGRCDFRVDEAGAIYFLEINPNCGIFYPPDAHGCADVILSLDPSTSHQAFIDHIVAAALSRHAARHKATEVKYRHGSGYGLYATRDIPEGDVVVAYEERPHVLVSRQHVARHWAPESLRAQWFKSYAFPLTAETWVTWSDEPDDWLPVNHSCDPNSWLVGLDLVARRPIHVGDHVTSEYATFCVDNMEAFDCSCGAIQCRKRVSGRDYLSDWIGQHYSGHVSDYIATKRCELDAGTASAAPRDDASS